MIIWLASYPRSGNTLLRTTLKQTMNLGSYSDELPPPNLDFTEIVQEEFGHLPLIGPWEDFYEMATTSKKVYLIKTHLPPQDDQPVIYVVRDGRHSLVSYHQYHQKFFPEYHGGLIELILGSDYYGSWSEHHANWTAGKRKVLLLRYEELVNASPELLKSIAQFIGHDVPIMKWTNPFDQLHKENPDFFRIGKIAWQGSQGWSELINEVFFTLHGDLMSTLGYATQESVEKIRASLPAELKEFIMVSASTQAEKKRLENTCKEQLSTISMLNTQLNNCPAQKCKQVGILCWRWLRHLFH
ncbi:MAG: sulfotransferase domain-containing protein [Gallionella sp.]